MRLKMLWATVFRQKSIVSHTRYRMTRAAQVANAKKTGNSITPPIQLNLKYIWPIDKYLDSLCNGSTTLDNNNSGLNKISAATPAPCLSLDASVKSAQDSYSMPSESLIQGPCSSNTCSATSDLPDSLVTAPDLNLKEDDHTVDIKECLVEKETTSGKTIVDAHLSKDDQIQVETLKSNLVEKSTLSHNIKKHPRFLKYYSWPVLPYKLSSSLPLLEHNAYCVECSLSFLCGKRHTQWGTLRLFSETCLRMLRIHRAILQFNSNLDEYYNHLLSLYDIGLKTSRVTANLRQQKRRLNPKWPCFYDILRVSPIPDRILIISGAFTCDAINEVRKTFDIIQAKQNGSAPLVWVVGPLIDPLSLTLYPSSEEGSIMTVADYISLDIWTPQLEPSHETICEILHIFTDAVFRRKNKEK